jgi:thiol-disulfide isomerase/thioredoxin
LNNTQQESVMPILPIIYDGYAENEPMTREMFMELLSKNPGSIVVKFGAEWCKPCATIKDLIYEWHQKLQDHVQLVIIDVDVSFDLYAFLKSKKIVTLLPTLLYYHKGNDNYAPNGVVIGTNTNDIDGLFLEANNGLGRIP